MPTVSVPPGEPANSDEPDPVAQAIVDSSTQPQPDPDPIQPEPPESLVPDRDSAADSLADQLEAWFQQRETETSPAGDAASPSPADDAGGEPPADSPQQTADVATPNGPEMADASSIESPPADPDPQPATPASIHLGDIEVPANEIDDLRDLYQWAKTVTPEQAQAIQAVLSGQFDLTPRAAGQSPGQTAGAASSPAPEADAALPQPDQFLDPELAKQVIDLKQQLQAIEDYQRQQIQSQQQSQRERYIAEIQDAQATFAQANELADPDIASLTQRVEQLGLIPALVRKHGGNMRAAMSEALETAMWSDATYRDRLVANQRQQQAVLDAQRQERKQAAAAISSSPGSIPRTTVSPEKMSREQRMSAMAQELATHINGSRS